MAIAAEDQPGMGLLLAGLQRVRLINEIPPFDMLSPVERIQRGVWRHEMIDQPGPPIPVHNQPLFQAHLLHPHPMRMNALHATFLAGQHDLPPGRRLLEHSMVALPVSGHPVQHVQRRVPTIPFQDLTAQMRADQEPLIRRPDHDLLLRIPIEIQALHVSPGPFPIAGFIGDGFSGDQVLVIRLADVEQIDATEHPMPVRAIALARPHVIEGLRPPRRIRESVNLPTDPEHLFVHLVDLRVFGQEDPPEPSPDEPEEIPSALRLQPMFEIRELRRGLRGQSPLAHLIVGGCGEVNPAERGKAHRVFAGGDRDQPVGVLLNSREEVLDPPPIPAMEIRPRPQAELLPIVSHHRHPGRGAGREWPLRLLPQPVDHLGDRGPGDRVSQMLGGAKDPQRISQLLGHVIAEEILIGQPDPLKVGVIHDGVLKAHARQGAGQMRLPHPLRQPETHRRCPEILTHRLDMFADLTLLILIGDHRQDRLIIGPGHDLHLASLHQATDSREELRPVLPQPVPQRPGVMESHPDPWMALQGRDHRLISAAIRFLKDPIKIPHRLVIVEGQRQINLSHTYFPQAV